MATNKNFTVRHGIDAVGTVTASSFTGAGTGLTGTASSLNIGGNSATTTKLATARAINGVNFDGTAPITIEDSTKLALAGGTMTGNLTMAAAGGERRIDFTTTGGTTTGLFGRNTDGAVGMYDWANNHGVFTYTPSTNTFAFHTATVSGNFSGTSTNVTGTVAIANGGTGATTAATARSNLGLGNVENKSSATIRGELTLSNVTGALGYTPASTVSQHYQSLRDFANGTLITTSIDYSVSESAAWLLEIRGNSYGNLIPFDVMVQGYIYSGTIINHGGIANGTEITGMIAQNIGGKLCFWFPRMAYWHGFTVYVSDVTMTGNKINAVTNISNSARPTGTKEVASTITKGWNSNNLTNLNQLTNGPGFITSAGNAANVTGTVAIANGGTGATTAAAALNNLGGVSKSEYRNLGMLQYNGADNTTATFLAWMNTQGFFDQAHTVAKFTWSYAGNIDVVDATVGTIELAGAVIEVFRDPAGGGGTYGQIIIRVTCPSSGTSMGKEYVYVDHGSTYAPGWRVNWNSATLTNLNQLSNGPGFVTAANTVAKSGDTMTGSLYTRGAYGMRSISVAGNPLLYDVQDQSGNVVIESGRIDGVASSSNWDFHTGTTAVDYDSRIQANGGDGTVGGGNLNLMAATVNFSGAVQYSNVGINAAGTTQAAATAITRDVTAIINATAGSAIDARLPTGLAGRRITVVNATGTTVTVWCNTGGYMNGFLNSYVNITANSAIDFVAIDGTRWYAIGAVYA